MRLHLYTTLAVVSTAMSSAATSDCSGGDDPSDSPTPSSATDCTNSFLIEQVNSFDQVDPYPDPELSVSCDGSFVYVTSNGIPSFQYDQVTPNALTAQNNSWKIPRNPSKAAATSPIWTGGPVGTAVDGLPIFAPNEAAQDGYGDPYVDGLLDYCMGHTAPGGQYHFHARPDCLFETVEGKVHLVVGWAFDGFSIVAPFECTDSGCGTVKEVKSSYVYVGGSENAYEANQYVQGSGDLDACNGMTASDGVYRYYSTDTFPYTLACFAGTPETSNNPTVSGGGQTGGGQTGGGTQGQSCNTSSDCTNACPAEAAGCTCAADPQGNQMCVPSCSNDNDCDFDPNQPLICEEAMGICVPPNGP